MWGHKYCDLDTVCERQGQKYVFSSRGGVTDHMTVLLYDVLEAVHLVYCCCDPACHNHISPRINCTLTHTLAKVHTLQSSWSYREKPGLCSEGAAMIASLRTLKQSAPRHTLSQVPTPQLYTDCLDLRWETSLHFRHPTVLVRYHLKELY